MKWTLLMSFPHVVIVKISNALCENQKVMDVIRENKTLKTFKVALLFIKELN